MNKLPIYILLMLFPLFCFGQNPGNVGTTHLTAWFKPDGLTIGNVTSWVTTYPTGVGAVTVTDATTPYPQATELPLGNTSNYNKTIAFTNSNTSPSQRLINTGTLDLLDNWSSTDYGTFIIAYYLPNTTQNDHFVVYNEAQDAIQFRNLGANGRMAIGKGSISFNACRNYPESKKPQIVSYTGNRSGATTMTLYNQSLVSTASVASASSGATGLYFGAKPGSTGFGSNSGLNGFMHEVIFYDTNLTTLELSKVHTYLAIKYGVSMLRTGGGTQGDYVATDGTIVWDASLTNAYHNDVIGLARDTTEGLLQKQSHAFNDFTRIYLGNALQTTNNLNTGTISNDISYCMLGSDDQSMCSTASATAEVPPGSYVTDRLEREYKITKTNFTETIGIDIKASACAAFSNLSCLRVLIDDDGDFTNATVYAPGSGLTISVVGNYIRITGLTSAHLPNNATKYLTIASVSPSIDLGMDTTICPNSSFVLNATITGASYLWHDGSNDSTYTVTSADTAWVEVNLLGCIGSDTIKIPMGLPPTVDLGADTNVCFGDTITLNAYNNGAGFLWHDGSTNSTFQVTTSGSYAVTVTDSCGTSSDTIQVIYNAYPIVDLGPDSTLCAGQVLTKNVGLPNATYRWHNNSVDSIYDMVFSGTFWVAVTQNNCTSSDTIITVFNPAPFVDLGLDTTICESDTINLAPGNLNSTFNWNDTSTNASLAVWAAGKYWVEVTTNNCMTSDTLMVSLDSLPISNLGPDKEVCDGEQMILAVSNTNTTYLWQDNSTASNFTVVQAGQYWVEATYNLCVSSDTVNVIYNPFPIIDLGPDTIICAPDSLWLDATFQGSSYKWNNNSINARNLVNNPGLYYVKVTRKNCAFSDSITISVQPKPSADLGADTIVCEGEGFTISTTSPGSDYLWHDGTTKNYQVVKNGGLYWVKVTNGNCFNIDSILITPIAKPIVNIGTDTLLCPGDSLVLSDTLTDMSLFWSTGATDSMIVVTTSGEYWLKASNECGEDKATVYVGFATTPEVDLGYDSIICYGDVIELDAYWPNSEYLWHDGSEEETFEVYEEGEYSVFVLNQCDTVGDTVYFEYENCDCMVFVPNAFTPNGDGLDDTFAPVANCTMEAYNLVIFDRWGTEVFASEDPEAQWNGQENGQYFEPGVFSYVIKYNFQKRGDKLEYDVIYGMVTLIR